MNERYLKGQLMQNAELFLRGSVVQNHSDAFTSGVPDFSVTWRKITTWWEVKFWNGGDFDTQPLQHATARRLAKQGFCHYVIYEVNEGVERIYICTPDEVERWRQARHQCSGHSHDYIVRFMIYLHHSVMVGAR